MNQKRLARVNTDCQDRGEHDPLVVGVSPSPDVIIVLINTLQTPTLPPTTSPPPPIPAQMQSTMIYNEIFLQNSILVIFPFADFIVIITLAVMPEMARNRQELQASSSLHQPK